MHKFESCLTKKKSMILNQMTASLCYICACMIESHCVLSSLHHSSDIRMQMWQETGGANDIDWEELWQNRNAYTYTVLIYRVSSCTEKMYHPLPLSFSSCRHFRSFSRSSFAYPLPLVFECTCTCVHTIMSLDAELTHTHTHTFTREHAVHEVLVSGPHLPLS